MRFVFLGLLWASIACAQDFIPNLPDIPLPEGAESESVFDFDTDDTHLTQVVVYAPSSLKETQQFYNETLPQLGWQSAGENHFKRGEDTLTLEPVSATKDLTTLRLQLKAEKLPK